MVVHAVLCLGGPGWETAWGSLPKWAVPTSVLVLLGFNGVVEVLAATRGAPEEGDCCGPVGAVGGLGMPPMLTATVNLCKATSFSRTAPSAARGDGCVFSGLTGVGAGERHWSEYVVARVVRGRAERGSCRFHVVLLWGGCACPVVRCWGLSLTSWAVLRRI